MTNKIVSAEAAIAIIHDGDTLATSGYGGHGVPEQLLIALETRFLNSQSPKTLTLVHSTGQGDTRGRGLDHFAHKGLIKRVIGGYYGLSPKLAEMAIDNQFEAYNFPEGCILQLYRDIGAGKPGTFTKVGLGTYIDPRLDGGRMNDVTKESLIEVFSIDGEDWLFYRSFPINVVFLRGTTADANGNISIEHEALILEDLALAIAAKNSGGYVICQVERIAEKGTLPSRRVRIPGMLVDCVVVAEAANHLQNFGNQYNPALSGELRVPANSVDPLPLNERKIIARRCAIELRANSVINLGIGIPEGIGAICSEERIQKYITLTTDTGIVGGVPMNGFDFGAATNADALIDHSSAFDFIDGGGLDIAFLGIGQADKLGNVNASKFGKRIIGCGGFINISQKSRKVVFVGTFRTGGLEVAVEDGCLSIKNEGKTAKYIDTVEQITFSGEVAVNKNQRVLFVTERCVFQLTEAGMLLKEVAPGIDIENDILAGMEFKPIVEQPGVMDLRLFSPDVMGLKDDLLSMSLGDRIHYDQSINTVFLNFAGLRIRTLKDVQDIQNAVEPRMQAIGQRVNSVVNYDNFVIDEDVMDAYADLVMHIESNYYLSVNRYTTSAFLRLKLGQELGARDLSSRIFETKEEARKVRGKLEVN